MVRQTACARRISRCFIAGGLLAGSLVLAGIPSQSSADLLAAVRGDAGEQRAMLIEAEELEKQLEAAGLRILDARSAEEHSRGHIPGAVPVDVRSWQELGRQEGGFHDAEAWASHVGQLGITHASRVVVYGSDLTNTARVWWTLKYLGLQDVSILNGGWPVWLRQQRPVDYGPVEVEATRFEPEFQADRLEEIDSLKKSIDDGSVTVVDARSAAEFSGEDVRGGRGGHVPGAKHLEWKELLEEDGRFKTPQQLRAVFRQRGIAPEQTAVTC